MNGIVFLIVFASSVGLQFVRAQATPDTPAWRLVRASEDEQIRAVNSVLDQGMRPDLLPGISLLIFNKSSLVLPMFEKKIEEVLKSTCSPNCFSDKSVNSQRFVDAAAWVIADTGDDQALKEVAKLMDVDEKRFGNLVGVVLDRSTRNHNPFVVAYHGFAIGRPAVDRRVGAWAESKLITDPAERAREEAAARKFGAKPAPPPSDKMKRAWAEAMLDQYGYLPTEAQWARDPIVSRLSPSFAASLHNEMMQLVLEAIERRGRK
ncbi:MAG: hypothetical protein C5B51_00350 [Terriglobia bacterium]|nr:MAG: hypothetical protein C5B51_00350 [Terriglobia bacterium]